MGDALNPKRVAGCRQSGGLGIQGSGEPGQRAAAAGQACAGFQPGDAPDVVYLENMTSDLYVEQEAEVYRYCLAFDRLRGLALTAGKSAEFMTTKADNIK
jgi:hypothetical protein